MIEVISVVGGFLARLLQQWLHTKDLKDERNHEYRMFEKQLELQHKEVDTKYDLEQAKNEFDAMKAALKDQMEEAKAAGGIVLALSASVRPVVTYWLLLMYSGVKIVEVAVICILFYYADKPVLALAIVDFLKSLVQVYTSSDGALLGSVLGYWFADRGIRSAFLRVR